ncbi:hypothetical protein Alsa1_CDS0006 [Staphylococcus phage Alsa_1]|nr:hypothetical protein Alsa1_CDS0006 [Staphylococcus phage Alsa_1]WNM50858.1 hypothetical protein Alsa2_CDS0244 [Staphylococcus phage Alsa_2]WNM50901.1 hypothetical protein Alsa3_CDS0032 [Staphylococcus phage Alsa_3]
MFFSLNSSGVNFFFFYYFYQSVKYISYFIPVI